MQLLLAEEIDSFAILIRNVETSRTVARGPYSFDDVLIAALDASDDVHAAGQDMVFIIDVIPLLPPEVD